LLEFAAGVLAAGDVDAIDEHLDGCHACLVVVRAAALRTGADDVETTLVSRRVGCLGGGETISRYRIVSVLGTGAMGEVYRATDPTLGRDVAIKVLHHIYDDPQLERRLTKEAQALAQLSHPNVVQVYDVGKTRGRVFLAMELVDGTTLRVWLQQRPRAVAEILDVFVAAARGIAAAHAAGLVHRDFKPDNVLVGRDGRARVSDFGLAYAAGEQPTPPRADTDLGSGGASSHRSTRTGWAVGTPAYMAPEQYVGREVFAASDQFAMCVALYEALYGERPFRGRDYQELRAAVLLGAFTIPHRRDVPRSVARAIARGLAHDPARRFPTVDALVRALRPRRRVLGAFAVASMTVVGVGFAIAHDRTTTCEGFDTEIAAAWSDTVGLRVRAAFDATGAAYASDAADRTIAALDAHAQRWIAARMAACEDARSGVRDDAGRAVVLACLDAQVRTLSATVAVLEAGQGPVVEQASSLVSQLDDPEDCRAALESPGVRDPIDDPEIARLHAVVEEAVALRRAGRVEDAYDLQQRHRADLDALAPGPLRIQALLSWGMIADERREPDTAIETLTAAHAMAIANASPKLAATAALRLAYVHSSGGGDREQAHHWLREGQLASRQVNDPRLASATVRAEAALHRAEGEHPRARALYQESLDILLREGDDDPRTTAGLWLMLGGQSRELGEYDRAELETNNALTIARNELGPRHPFVARAYAALADTARARGDSAAARGFVDAGIAIERGHGDARGLTLPLLLYQRGLIEQELGEHARAIETLEEAVALYREVDSEDRTSAPLTVMALSQLELGQLDAAHANLLRALELEYRRGQRARTAEGQVLHNLGEVEAAMGRVADARRRYTTAIELLESALGPQAALLSLPLTGLGELELAEGNPTLARALLERALPLCSPLIAERDELGETSFALARALWADPGATAEDRRRAIDHARSAADAFAEAGPHEARRRDEAVRWVEDHQAQVEGDVVAINPRD